MIVLGLTMGMQPIVGYKMCIRDRIHRSDCPNANQMRERFGYRIVKARWAGKSEGTQYPITLRVVGHDDIGIVTNITSIISKENGITLRSIGIDSNDGLFSGTLKMCIRDRDTCIEIRVHP